MWSGLVYKHMDYVLPLVNRARYRLSWTAFTDRPLFLIHPVFKPVRAVRWIEVDPVFVDWSLIPIHVAV